MSSCQWIPKTLEDRLLERYARDNPGLLFLEVEVGEGDAFAGPRRLDGVMVPAEESQFFPQGTYSRNDIAAAVKGRSVHVLEAKRKLNRTVIGQVEVGVALLKREFEPASVLGVAVYAQGNADLEWYCSQQNIKMTLYPEERPRGRARILTDGRVDMRKPPDPGRKQAFMKGWDVAVSGTLYDSIQTTKTHANMGNLFGWIYGDVSDEFREQTWDRYVESLSLSPG